MSLVFESSCLVRGRRRPLLARPSWSVAMESLQTRGGWSRTFTSQAARWVCRRVPAPGQTPPCGVQGAPGLRHGQQTLSSSLVQQALPPDSGRPQPRARGLCSLCVFSTALCFVGTPASTAADGAPPGTPRAVHVTVLPPRGSRGRAALRSFLCLSLCLDPPWLAGGGHRQTASGGTSVARICRPVLGLVGRAGRALDLSSMPAVCRLLSHVPPLHPHTG